MKWNEVKQGETTPMVLTPPTNFTDERGTITNLLNGNITAIAMIFSKKGSVRSNHFHKKDVHWLYVVSGKMLYSERKQGETVPDGVSGYDLSVVVYPGQMVFTPTNMVHRTQFFEDTVLLSLGNYDNHDEDTFKEEF